MAISNKFKHLCRDLEDVFDEIDELELFSGLEERFEGLINDLEEKESEYDRREGEVEDLEWDIQKFKDQAEEAK